jgi:hypothetical protein
VNSNDTGSSFGDFSDGAIGSSALNPDGLKGISLGGISSDTPSSSFSMGKLFGDNPLSGISSTGLQGIGAIAQVAGSIYDAYNKQKYKDKIFGMEQDRVNREVAKQTTQQNNYNKVFG